MAAARERAARAEPWRPPPLRRPRCWRRTKLERPWASYRCQRRWAMRRQPLVRRAGHPCCQLQPRSGGRLATHNRRCHILCRRRQKIRKPSVQPRRTAAPPDGRPPPRRARSASAAQRSAGAPLRPQQLPGALVRGPSPRPGAERSHCRHRWRRRPRRCRWRWGLRICRCSLPLQALARAAAALARGTIGPRMRPVPQTETPPGTLRCWQY
mmetsp:Transcript_108554/g.231846  ORF Transcript_108554/g.231846 Transcript_108554/m.231846 type:complete len:211 (-) Transcript_108554:359-991(-)